MSPLKDFAAGALEVLNDPDRPAAVSMSDLRALKPENASRPEFKFINIPSDSVTSNVVGGTDTMAPKSTKSPSRKSSTSTLDLNPKRKLNRVSGKEKKKYTYWTAEQETALMTAMEAVGGAKWALIISRYGEGGTINDILKGRDKPSLYGKAAHIKARLINNGDMVPTYLAKIKPTPPKKRSCTYDADSGSEGDKNMERRTKGHPRRSSPKHDDCKVSWKTIKIEDEKDGDSDEVTLEPALPKKAPKKQQQQTIQKPKLAKDGTAENDYQMMELQLQQARAAREEAAAKREESRLELEMFKVKHQRNLQR